MARRKNIYVIAGPNGAGKTTFATLFLPRYVACTRFVNPDLIARGLSPFDPAAADIRAGRLVLEQMGRHIAQGLDFAIETTLSGRAHAPLLSRARTVGYSIKVYYLWVPSPQLALSRIADRVEDGGHDVPPEAVERRYPRSLHNLFDVYAELADAICFFDNSGSRPHLVFVERNARRRVLDRATYSAIMKEVRQ